MVKKKLDRLHERALRYLYSADYPSTNSSVQISNFPQFNFFFEKKYLFPKMFKNHPNIYTKPPNGGYGNEQRDLALLKT